MGIIIVPDSGRIPDRIWERLKAGEALDLELGCGDRKRHAHAVGIDVLEYEGVDIVGEIEATLARLPDDSIQNVYAYHCLEHLENLDRILNQLARVMKSKGDLIVEVPHFSNPYYYSDHTHRQPFGLYTFSYLARDALFRRRCPTYQREINFELKRVKLVFKSPPPFYGRYGIKKIFQYLFNVNRYTIEFYEENLCWIIPCYEIRYELERL